MVIDQRLTELPVPASDFEPIRLQLLATGPLLAQRLSLCDQATHCLLQALDPLWGPRPGAPHAGDSLSGQ